MLKVAILLALAVLVYGDDESNHITVETHLVPADEVSKFMLKAVSPNNFAWESFYGNITPQCYWLILDTNTVQGTPGMFTIRDVTYFRQGARFTAIFARQEISALHAPYILRGGLGQDTVTLRMASDQGQGMSYLVEIFGRL